MTFDLGFFSQQPSDETFSPTDAFGIEGPGGQTLPPVTENPAGLLSGAGVEGPGFVQGALSLLGTGVGALFGGGSGAGIGGLAGNVLGGVAGLLGFGGADGPDPVLQARRVDNRQRSAVFLDRLAAQPRFAGVGRQDILESVLRDAGLVGDVVIPNEVSGKDRIVRFREGDVASLGAIGQRGTQSKRGDEAFQRFTGRDLVVNALASAAGFQTAGTLFGFVPATAPRAAVAGAQSVPNVNTSGTEQFGPAGPANLVEGGFTGSGPGLDLGDFIGSNSVLANLFSGGLADAGAAVGEFVGGGGILGAAANLFGFGDPGVEQQPSTFMPGGAMFPGFSQPTTTGGAPVPQVNTSGGGLTIQPRTSTRSRLPSMVATVVQTPSGGQRVVAYKNMGRPMLWSGDLAAARRVRKVAAKARRSRGGR